MLSSDVNEPLKTWRRNGARSVLFILLAATAITCAGCVEETSDAKPAASSTAEVPEVRVHPRVDFEHWVTLFPMESFQRTEGPRQFSTTGSDDPLDLWKPRGQIITSPSHLCEVELARRQYADVIGPHRSVPVDLFLWSTDPPKEPYLTKLGGVPHRESTKPWPTHDGKTMTFVAQFCFVDSMDIVSDRLPGEIMLVFFPDADCLFDQRPIFVEWSSTRLSSPAKADDCPAPSFIVPQLSGHIYRTREYPESQGVFEQAGHDQSYLLATTQATKIGRETFFIQNDPRTPDDELLCTLCSIHPQTYPPGAKWPMIGLESLPDDWRLPDEHTGWGRYEMMFADVGCLYFLIDRQGRVKVEWSCY